MLYKTLQDHYLERFKVMELSTVLSIFFVVMTTLFGVVIGSFLNVVIYRIPEGRTIVKGHSRCMSCGHELGALDLVPIFSWLFLGGKCRYCKAPIASRYIKIESFTGLVFLTFSLSHMNYQLDILNLYEKNRLVMFATYCVTLMVLASLVSSMMIYYDKQRSFYGYCVFSGCAAVVLSAGTAFITSFKAAAAYLLISVSVALIIVGILALFSRILRKKYTKTDFWLDLPYAFYYAYFGKLSIGYEYAIIASILLLILPRLVLKGTKLDKYSAIVLTCGLVLVNIIGFIIKRVFDNLLISFLVF